MVHNTYSYRWLRKIVWCDNYSTIMELLVLHVEVRCGVPTYVAMEHIYSR